MRVDVPVDVQREDVERELPESARASRALAPASRPSAAAARTSAPRARRTRPPLRLQTADTDPRWSTKAAGTPCRASPARRPPRCPRRPRRRRPPPPRRRAARAGPTRTAPSSVPHRTTPCPPGGRGPQATHVGEPSRVMACVTRRAAPRSHTSSTPRPAAPRARVFRGAYATRSDRVPFSFSPGANAAATTLRPRVTSSASSATYAAVRLPALPSTACGFSEPPGRARIRSV